jgi:hypothetical protein
MEKRKVLIKLNFKGVTPLNEDLHSDFSNKVYFLMKSLYDGNDTDAKLNLVGNQNQILAFFSALQREKRYMDSYTKHGLDSAHTMTSKYELDKSVKKFEYETGLRWPFKN